MDTKFFSNNKFAIVLTILFIILLNYHDTFKFLLTTLVGRIILVQSILAISAFSIMFGVISVLFVIIRMNQRNINLEGLKNDKDEKDEKYKYENNLMNSSVAATTYSLEGFNFPETETTILKGKDSSQIPVNRSTHTNDYTDPYSKMNSSPATF
jgi:hypothetical protein